MAKLTGKSSLSDEKIQADFENVDVFSDIVTGLEEAIAYEDYRKGSLIKDFD